MVVNKEIWVTMSNTRVHYELSQHFDLLGAQR